MTEDAVETEKWYLSLDENSKTLLKETISIAIKEAIFGVLVVLDNRTGGFPIVGKESDFALYLQTYEDEFASAGNRPQEKVRFNSIQDDELHDQFIALLKEMEET